MIRKEKDYFILDTNHTTYCFRVLPTGQLEHLYYGRKLHIEDEADMQPLVEKHVFAPGNVNLYNKEQKAYSLEDMRLEMSSYGKGDIREPFVEVVNANGSNTIDFVYKEAEITKGKEAFAELPGSYGSEEEVEQLCIRLADEGNELALELYYYVYPSCDIISRSAKFYNNGKKAVQLKRLMSLQLDFDGHDYAFTTFHGAWAREMKRSDMPVTAGRLVNASYTGTTSSRANSFVMLSRPKTTEDAGECFGFHLIYSGNHYEATEVNSFGKMRLVTGINPQAFSYEVVPEESFQAPEAVMAYAENGFNQMSQRLHHFIREHIIRGTWQKKERPILLNSWEASYFDISEKKLLKLAKEAKEVGIELFVMDDGWFGERMDDSSSLGDWEANAKKLPGGLKGLSDKIRGLGLQFGIWVEPEMVNVKSKLYVAHPDWTIEIPGQPHSEGRNQRILDLGRREVQDYIIESMSKVFSSADISYVKWDMNRTFSDYYSTALPPERQGEVAHRYVLGLYRCMRKLTERFPEILFEGCAAGGNRFDLGILCYFPQIWGSDDTDALCRAEIEENYSYGYPLSAVSAHVSACPNHQTLRNTPLETRFQVACFGSFGYECNLCDMKKEEKEAMKEQIALYKKWRKVLQQGTFYRGRSFYDGTQSGMGGSVLADEAGNQMEWTCVSEDGTKAVGMLMQKLVVPNMQQQTYYPKGLLADVRYHFYNRKLKYNIKEFGDLVNTVSPVHIKQDSLTHQVLSKLVKMDGETEDFHAYGDTLMYGGVHVSPAFGGTGYNDKVRHYPDFASRLYFMDGEVKK